MKTTNVQIKGRIVNTIEKPWWMPIFVVKAVINCITLTEVYPESVEALTDSHKREK